MAKRTVSFSLESDIIKAIDKYQKDNDLSSRSIALERIVLSKVQSTTPKIDEEYLISLINKVIASNAELKEDDVSKKSIIDKSIVDAISSTYDSMPD